MRWSRKLASAFVCLALAACAATATAPLRIRDAGVSDGVLAARLAWQPSAEVLDALDNGILLDFVVDLRALGPSRLGWRSTLAQTRRHIELRYFPLSRRYQLRDLDRGETRSFAARSLLLAALEDLRLRLPDDWPAQASAYALSVALDRDRLPGALRLPALLRADWRVNSGEYRWQTSGAG
jgi:hypothetical protein